MKKLLVIAWLASFVIAAGYAQGTVSVVNSSRTLISVRDSNSAVVMPGNAGTQDTTYYFALLSGPQGSTDLSSFQFTGVYATNWIVSGIIRGGNAVQCANWPAGAVRSFCLVGWSADAGASYNPVWLTLPPWQLTMRSFGVSSIATGRAGGWDPLEGNIPALSIFSDTAISTGFTLAPIPEPGPGLLLIGGSLLCLLWRHRSPVTQHAD